MQKLRIDKPITTYALTGAAALVVSAPATYNLVALYHADGTTVGVVATVALLVILEVGAVAAKLATLWTPRNHGFLQAITLGALGVNTLSNFIHGGAVATANGLGWLSAWGGALVYAAALPAIVYAMLHLICDRVSELRGEERSVGEEVARLLQPVTHAAETVRQASATLAAIVPPPALPEPQAIYPRAEAVAMPVAAQPVLMLPSACPECGAEPSKMQRRTAAQHNGWNCKGCGARVSPR